MSDRRSFLGKITALAATAMAAPFVAISNSVKQSNSPVENSQKEKDINIIKQIKPLGFIWETEDPFLFCVHH